MIQLALKHELSLTLRSWARISVLVAFVAASAYATFAGLELRNNWTATFAAADAEQTKSIESALGWLEEGVPGPEDRPWVDISTALWQDWYAGSRVKRLPGKLSGIAAGAVDDSPTVMRVNRLADPFEVTGLRLKNPEFDSTQSIDLVFVFAIMIPILIGVMGVPIGGQEREEGMQQVIAVQAGSAGRWLLSRTIAVSILSISIVLAVCVGVVVTTQASVSEGLQFTLVSSLYTILWCGLLLTLSVTARSLREGAFAFGLSWALICILIPAFLSGRALSTASTLYEQESSLGARAERYESYERDIDEILPELYAAFPKLKSLPAAELDALPPEVRRHAHDGVLLLALERRHAKRLASEQHAEAVALRSAWLSPAIAVSHSFERLANQGSYAASQFRSFVTGAIRQRVEWVLQQAWQQRSLSRDDFSELLEEQATELPPHSASVKPHLSALATWTVLIWLLGCLRLARQEWAE